MFIEAKKSKGKKEKEPEEQEKNQSPKIIHDCLDKFLAIFRVTNLHCDETVIHRHFLGEEIGTKVALYWLLNLRFTY